MTNVTTGPVVGLADVFKTYKVGEVEVPAVKGISFSIPRQRFSMIVGPSGSGKTTLLNLIRERRIPAVVVGDWAGRAACSCDKDARGRRPGGSTPTTPEPVERWAETACGHRTRVLPLTRHSLFARADWVDAFTRHLELTGFVNTDLYDGSGLVQIAADYYLSDTWTIGVQANSNVGSARSDFGSLPGTGSMLFKAARYFR